MITSRLAENCATGVAAQRRGALLACIAARRGICSCSIAQNVDILSAQALSHQVSPYVRGIARRRGLSRRARARVSTVLSQYEGDTARICACSMTKRVRILVAHVLSHRDCQYVHAIARLAPPCAVQPPTDHFSRKSLFEAA